MVLLPWITGWPRKKFLTLLVIMIIVVIVAAISIYAWQNQMAGYYAFGKYTYTPEGLYNGAGSR